MSGRCGSELAPMAAVRFAPGDRVCFYKSSAADEQNMSAIGGRMSATDPQSSSVVHFFLMCTAYHADSGCPSKNGRWNNRRVQFIIVLSPSYTAPGAASSKEAR